MIPLQHRPLLPRPLNASALVIAVQLCLCVGLLVAQPAPIAGRKESRAKVALDHEIERLRDALDRVAAASEAAEQRARLMAAAEDRRRVELEAARTAAAAVEAQAVTKLARSPESVAVAKWQEKIAASEVAAFRAATNSAAQPWSDTQNFTHLRKMLDTLQLTRLQLSITTSDPSPGIVDPDNRSRIPQDFEAFKATLPSFSLHLTPEGEPALLPAAELTPVSYFAVEEDIALEELDLLLFHMQALDLQRLPADTLANRPAFSTSFTSADPSTSPLVQTPLRATTEQDQIVRWVPGVPLKYCVLKWTFGADQNKYELVKANMRAAAADWAKACGVTFVHVEEHDAVPRGTVFPLDSNNARKVLFVVAQKDIPAIAMAFFPNDPRSRRLLWVDPEDYFTTRIDKVGVLRHELGHVLGFRHEHISPDAPVWTSAFCKVESNRNSKPILGGYDRKSVMHYPCEGQLGDGPVPENFKLIISDLDKLGAQAVYGPAGGTAPQGVMFRNFDPN